MAPLRPSASDPDATTVDTPRRRSLISRAARALPLYAGIVAGTALVLPGYETTVRILTGAIVAGALAGARVLLAWLAPRVGTVTAWAGLAVAFAVAVPAFLVGVNGGCGVDITTGDSVACTPADVADLVGVGLMLTALLALLLLVPARMFKAAVAVVRHTTAYIRGTGPLLPRRTPPTVTPDTPRRTGGSR